MNRIVTILRKKRFRKILRFYIRNYHPLVAFVRDRKTKISRLKRLIIANKIRIAHKKISSPHTQSEIMKFVRLIIGLGKKKDGVIVEAGCFKGSSTAKFSVAVGMVARELVVFDSFSGLPDNEERHDRSISGVKVDFKKGDYAGSLDEVTKNVRKYGNIRVCRFIKGWFKTTLPSFKQEIAAAFLDVDLVESTRTCLVYLFPLLKDNGVILSHDGHLPLVVDLLNDREFWEQKVGWTVPKIDGLGTEKLLIIRKGTSRRIGL